MTNLITFKKPLSSPTVENIDIQKTNKLVVVSLLSHISKKAQHQRLAVSLESLTWDNDLGSLTNIISQLPKLKTLALSFSTDTSKLEDLAKSITDNCPNFRSLRIIESTVKINEILPNFLRGFKQNTLCEFMSPSNIEDCSLIGHETILSLNHHAKSLTTLKLPYITSKLSLLSCRNLISLQLSKFQYTWISAYTYEELIDWICSNRGLRELSVGVSEYGERILTDICNQGWIQLQKIEVDALIYEDSEDFFAALSTQESLKYLRLRGNIINWCREVERNFRHITWLSELKFLDMRPRTMTHCLKYDTGLELSAVDFLTENFDCLEELSFGCHLATDYLWKIMTKFRHLRSLTIICNPRFTCEGTLAYVNALHDTNKGLDLTIVTCEQDSVFTGKERSSIQQAIKNKVGGYFVIQILDPSLSLEVEATIEYEYD
ncbi:hypothetical protein K3495_g8520 [Podosphaera aphanis]|nr:hypothetical protein K3495_g8520 [Podosphaera aphanis]